MKVHPQQQADTRYLRVSHQSKQFYSVYKLHIKQR